MDKNDARLISGAMTIIRQFEPKAKLEHKSTSWLHKTIGFLIKPFNKNYMKQYWTTLGFSIAAPGKPHWPTVFHEGVHVIQAKKYSRPLFYFLYLFPQVLALLAILAPFLGWAWLLALLFLLPIPAPFRMLFELEAYCITVAVHQWMHGSMSRMDIVINGVVKNRFKGKDYWHMWPFNWYVKKRLHKAQDDAFFLRYNLSDPYEIAILQFLIDNDKLEEHGTITGAKGATE